VSDRSELGGKESRGRREGKKKEKRAPTAALL